MPGYYKKTNIYIYIQVCFSKITSVSRQNALHEIDSKSLPWKMYVDGMTFEVDLSISISESAFCLEELEIDLEVVIDKNV